MISRAVRVGAWLLAVAAVLCPGLLVPAAPASAHSGLPVAASTLPSPEAQAAAQEWTLSPGSAERVLTWSPVFLRVPAALPLQSVTLRDVEVGARLPLTGEVSVSGRGSEAVVQVTPPALEDGVFALEWVDADGPHEAIFRVAQSGPERFAPLPLLPDPPSRAWAAVLALGCVAAVAALVLLAARGVLPASAALALAALALAGAGVAGWWSASDPVDAAAAECRTKGEHGQRVECLAEAVLLAWSSGGPDRAEVLLVELDADPAFANGDGLYPCHDAAHTAGRVLARSGVPVMELVSAPVVACNAGVMHGAVEGWAPVATDEELIEFVPVACAGLPPPPEGSGMSSVEIECVHGLGHAVAFRFGYDIPRAFEVCSALPSPVERMLCVEGVVMVSATAYRSLLPRVGRFDAAVFPPGMQALPVRACEGLEPESELVCFVGLFRYFAAPLAERGLLPEEAHPDRLWEYCAGFAEGPRLRCHYGLGSAYDNLYDDRPLAVRAAECAAAVSDIDRWACVGGYYASYSGGLESYPTDDATLRASLCRAAEVADARCARSLLALRFGIPGSVDRLRGLSAADA